MIEGGLWAKRQGDILRKIGDGEEDRETQASHVRF